MKTCTHCKLTKPLTEFNKRSGQKDGLNYRCRSCANAATRLSEAKKRPQIQLTNSEWKKKNPEKVKKDNRKWRLKNHYGLTEDQYDEMFLNQEGRCAICQRHRDELKEVLAVDHNHSTGKVRQLLCRPCNSVLGYIKEDVDIALNLVEYIRRHNASSIN